ncbi:Flocculation suppression protein [Recurvomyces mirabilis]|nr:Flocculation suppression protein [Recurvomyces mirabilis]
MAAVGLTRSPFQGESHSFHSQQIKSIPILPSAAAHTTHTVPPFDAMDVSPRQQQQQSAPTASMAPPSSDNASGDKTSKAYPSTPSEQHQHLPVRQTTTNGIAVQPVGAAAAAQQPKVVQTAFIHKLYKMLEDQTIQHLISWSSTNESFVMSPSSDFSKVLAQYFKHTNISSFVRQLNMYGFHKVSDVFHTGSPDAPLWEFKHGAGNFKRGDLVGLREIKRRASRHALIHRDSFPAPAPKMPVPTLVGPPIEQMADPLETRLNLMDWTQQELFTRLVRTEEAYAAVTAKCQTLLENMTKCYQWNQDLSTQLLALVPDPDNPVHREIYAMRQDISRQTEQLRNVDEVHDSSFGNKQSYFPNTAVPVEPVMPASPRQRPFDDSRRPSLQAMGRPGSFRSGMPSHLQTSPRRYGSIGTGHGAYSPTSSRPAYPPPPPPPQPQHQQPHPLSNMQSPPANLARRHTSADIRNHGWQGGQPPSSYNHGSSPYASGQSSSAWPSSPRATANPGDQQLRDALAQYELPRASHMSSRQHSPPPPAAHDSGVPSFGSSFGNYANPNDAGWQLPGPKYPFRNLETPGGPSRRSSMASNVHSLLNPADTAEREGEDEGPDERKRKRVL